MLGVEGYIDAVERREPNPRPAIWDADVDLLHVPSGDLQPALEVPKSVGTRGYACAALDQATADETLHAITLPPHSLGGDDLALRGARIMVSRV